jgi:hypothetical protein
MDEFDEQQKDRLKSFHLLEEVRRLGNEIDEPIQFTWLIKDGKLSDEKASVPLSKIDNVNLLKYLKPKHKGLIPVLLKYFHEFETDNYKSLIVSALSVKGFTDATEALLNEYYSASNDEEHKWAISYAFSIIMDIRYEEKYIEIINDKKHSKNRGEIVITLGKLKSEKALPVIIKLLDDEDVYRSALVALGNYKRPELKKYIEPFLNHEDSWTRKTAKKAIEKIEKANEK